ncbi:MAG: hypothetical protein QOF30_894 [Acidimicrobiaceae bacterium]|nr:hypothetical protein [Acidimicrobiaceae bacterium]
MPLAPDPGDGLGDFGLLTIRSATASDAGFLAEMLAIAVDWQPGISPRPVGAVRCDPALARYVSGWPREGDVGFVGVTRGGQPVGAAWWRFFTPDDAGYGFFDRATPEVSIGVVTEVRGHGLGTRLLQALIDEGRRRALPGISLSVERGNRAWGLYQRMGFGVVGREDGGSATMVLLFRPWPHE